MYNNYKLDNNDNSNIYKLYNQVFGNIVISRRIFNDIRLYKKNEIVTIDTRSELLEYKEREYIQSLIYNGIELNGGDIPNNGVLKKITFGKNIFITEENVIPFGVEIIDYSDKQIINTPFSSLPCSVHTIKNSVVILPVQKIPITLTTTIQPKTKKIKYDSQVYLNNLALGYRKEIIGPELLLELLGRVFGESEAANYKKRIDDVKIRKLPPDFRKDYNLQDVLDKTNEIIHLSKLVEKESNISNNYYTIPPNITSLSFLSRLDSLSDNTDEYKFIIPNTIKELIFENSNNGISGDWKSLCKDDIPEGVTSLSTFGDLNLLGIIGILPNSIKNLNLFGLSSTNSTGYFNFIMDTNIESLTIESIDVSIISNSSNLFQCNSIKKLLISNLVFIEPNSLPPSITELVLSNISSSIFDLTSIPSSVTCLDLSNKNNDKFYLTSIKIPSNVTNLILPTQQKN